MTHLTHIAVQPDPTHSGHSSIAKSNPYRSTATHTPTPTVSHAHAVTRHTDTGYAADALLCRRIHWSITQTDTI